VPLRPARPRRAGLRLRVKSVFQEILFLFLFLLLFLFLFLFLFLPTLVVKIIAVNITYRTDTVPMVEQVIELYRRASLPRPVNDTERMQSMLDNSNLVLTAWDKQKLVGICRCMTDRAWCTYLSDLAVDPDYKQSGIGRKLIDLTRQQVGELTMILLLSVPNAFEYYPKVGFTKEDRAFMIPRNK
jgi:ribosomal protein S18 acetylase RimI-like enzyme